jgi:hypothetical protein
MIYPKADEVPKPVIPKGMPASLKRKMEEDY